MKTTNALRHAFGIACIAMMFTACSKDELATPSAELATGGSSLSVLTDDHKESRTRAVELQQKDISIHVYSTVDEEKGGRIKFIRKPVKITDAEPVCMRCEGGSDGTTIDLKDAGVQ
ncbi:MAG: hypothetical protein ACKO1U_01250 [Bacteroidota bacterium]